METLSCKTLLYDKECPMCTWYTGKFIRMGVLPETGRLPFDEMDAEHFKRIDPDRARHEIALIDRDGGPTLYGLDSLFTIFKQIFPKLKGLFSSSLMRWLLYPLYQLITYNRRLISGNTSEYTPGSCIPDFNWFWRVQYLLLGLVAGGLTLWGVSMKMGSPDFLLLGMGWLVLMLVGLQFQQRPMDYLGHLTTLILIQSLLLAAGLLITAIAGVPLKGMLFALFLLSAAINWWQHERRIAVLKESQVWTALWGLLIVGNALVAWMINL